MVVWVLPGENPFEPYAIPPIVATVKMGTNGRLQFLIVIPRSLPLRSWDFVVRSSMARDLRTAGWRGGLIVAAALTYGRGSRRRGGSA